jgi:hypothetical protein
VACKDNAIDFIFVQYHQPHQSELWTSGNNPLSGIINTKVKHYLKKCNKAGAVFFGHTHGYSRGMDQHTHLFKVNVAGAGGHLDYWGKYNKDYKDFTRTLDEHGFMVFEVESGDKPKFKGTRWGLGDKQSGLKAPHIRDQFEYRKHNHAPNAPELFADKNIFHHCKGTIATSDFEDMDGDSHYSTEWKVHATVKVPGRRLPVVRKHKKIAHYENIYNGNSSRAGWDPHEDFDTREGKSLKSREFRFREHIKYQVVARYRDSSLKWSSWSKPFYFECK